MESQTFSIVSCNCIFSSYTQKPPREIPKTFIKMKAFKITAVFGLLLALGSSIGHARPQAEENEEPFNVRCFVISKD